jgi:hypothetical protein
MNSLLAAAATSAPTTTELVRTVEESSSASPTGDLVAFVFAVPLLALTFSIAVKLLGLFWGRFKTEGGGFGALYAKMLIAATAFVIIRVIGLPLWLGVPAMGVVYNRLFGAGWFEALIIGVIGYVLAVAVLVGAAVAFGAA